MARLPSTLSSLRPTCSRPSVYLPTDLLSIFDPYGNAVHTALSFNMVGEDVIITGAGPIGIMAAMVAGHCGARNVILTDVNEYRLDLAKRIVPKRFGH